MTASTEPRPKRRGILGILALLFFAPVAVAFFLYYGRSWTPGGNTSHGELINPARPLPEVSLPTPEGGTSGEQFLKQKWSLVYVGAGSCDDTCRQSLHNIRQVRLSLAEKMERVQRVFLYTGSCCEQPFFSKEHEGVIAVSADCGGGRQMLERFPLYNDVPPAEAGRIYIVDPLGNLMMSYPAGANPKGMREDLKKLLKLSHIG